MFTGIVSSMNDFLEKGAQMKRPFRMFRFNEPLAFPNDMSQTDLVHRRYFELSGKTVTNPGAIECISNGLLNNAKSTACSGHIHKEVFYRKDPEPLRFPANRASGLIRMHFGLLSEPLNELLIQGQQPFLRTL